MSILESFLLLFEADTTDLKKGGEEAKRITDDVKKKIVDTKKETSRLGESFLGMVNSAKQSLLALAGIGAITMGIRGAQEFAAKLGEVSEAAKVNVESLDLWSGAVQDAGGSAETFQQTVVKMSKSLDEFTLTGTSSTVPFFQALGIKITDSKGKVKDFIDLLPDLAGAFEKLSDVKSAAIGEKMGLDEGTIKLLQRGKKGVAEFLDRQKELGIVTKKDVEESKRFNLQLGDTGHAFRSLFNVANRFILPIFSSVLKSFERLGVYLRQHPGIIKVLGAALIGLGLVFAPITTAIALVTTAFSLLTEDLDAFEKGNNSLIGELMKKYPVAGKIVYGVAVTMREAFHLVGKSVELVITLIKKLFESLAVIGHAISWAFDKAAAAYDKIKSKLGLGKGNVSASVISGQQSLAAASATPLASITSNAISSANRSLTKYTTVPIQNVNIQTQASNAQDISTDISKQLDVHIRQAIQNSDDGVRI